MSNNGRRPRSLLVDISKKLREQDIRGIAFLEDIPDQDVENNAFKLFTQLEKRDLVSEDGLGYLAQLLARIRRVDLRGMIPKSLVGTGYPKPLNGYRALLYEVFADMSSYEIQTLRYSLRVPERTQTNDGLDLCQCLIELGHVTLNHESLRKLGHELRTINRVDLANQVDRFMAKNSLKPSAAWMSRVPTPEVLDCPATPMPGPLSPRPPSRRPDLVPRDTSPESKPWTPPTKRPASRVVITRYKPLPTLPVYNETDGPHILRPGTARSNGHTSGSSDATSSGDDSDGSGNARGRVRERKSKWNQILEAVRGIDYLRQTILHVKKELEKVTDERLQMQSRLKKMGSYLDQSVLVTERELQATVKAILKDYKKSGNRSPESAKRVIEENLVPYVTPKISDLRHKIADSWYTMTGEQAIEFERKNTNVLRPKSSKQKQRVKTPEINIEDPSGAVTRYQPAYPTQHYPRKQQPQHFDPHGEYIDSSPRVHTEQPGLPVSSNPSTRQSSSHLPRKQEQQLLTVPRRRHPSVSSTESNSSLSSYTSEAEEISESETGIKRVDAKRKQHILKKKRYMITAAQKSWKTTRSYIINPKKCYILTNLTFLHTLKVSGRVFSKAVQIKEIGGEMRAYVKSVNMGVGLAFGLERCNSNLQRQRNYVSADIKVVLLDGSLPDITLLSIVVDDLARGYHSNQWVRLDDKAKDGYFTGGDVILRFFINILKTSKAN